MSEDKTLKENISTGSLASLRNGSSVAARKHCSIISSNFLLLLNFIPLGISFIPLDHPQTIVLPPGCFYSFQVFGKLQILIDPLFFFLLLKCQLLSSMDSCLFFFEIKNQWKLQKLNNSLTSFFGPLFHLLRKNFFPRFITSLPKVPYTLIKLLQFFWGLWINLHLFSLLAFDLLLLIV